MIDLLVAGGLLLMAGALVLTNLGDIDLWQDEAQTALIAETVLAHGIPLGTDGRNFFSQEEGAEYGPHYVWRWHTWLPFYVLAAFFALFGVGTWTARLPFALFGIGTVLLAYVFARSLLLSRRVGAVAAFLLATSIPFLLLSRQCRYYSLAAFFSLVGLHGYRMVVEHKKHAAAVFVLASVLLFHTHYIYWAALLGAVLADAALLHRSVLRKVGVLSAVTLAINLPWILWLASIPYTERYTLFDPSHTFSLLKRFLRQIGRWILPPLLLVVPISLGVFRRLKREAPLPEGRVVWKRSMLLVLFIASNLLLLAASGPDAFFRYLAPVLPPCIVLIAWIVEAAARRHVAAGIAIVAVLLARQPLRDYLYELTHDFDGPVEGIVRYLNEHGKPEDVVAVTYEDLPLKFYTKMRVVGGLTGEALPPTPDADWIIVRKHVIGDKRVRQYLVESALARKYETIEIDYPDTAFQNRESPGEHRFRTATDEDRVVIHERSHP